MYHRLGSGFNQVVTSCQVACCACSFVVEDQKVQGDRVQGGSRGAACHTEVVEVPYLAPSAGLDGPEDPSWEVVSRTVIAPEAPS